jgi:beta-glucanase (GH16 family)
MVTIAGFQRIWAIVLLSAITALADPPPGFNWIQTFDDEFNGTALDTTKWHPHDHNCGTRNNELQAYEPENVTVANGCMLEKAEKRSVSYAYCGSSGNTKQYASGMAITEGKFTQKYGYFEASIKLPRGRGMWPAFWTLPTPYSWPPEADIMEDINQGDGSVVWPGTNWFAASNYPSGGGGTKATFWQGGYPTGYQPDLSAAFHIYGMDWEPDSVRFYLDGRKIGNAITQYTQPNCGFFMMINLAISPNFPPNDAMLPCTLKTDWVRVWQKGTTLDKSPHTFRAQPSITPSYANGTLRINAPANCLYRCCLTDATGRISASHEGIGPWTIPRQSAKGIYQLSLQHEGRSFSTEFVMQP